MPRAALQFREAVAEQCRREAAVLVSVSLSLLPVAVLLIR
jgi:hypothetical protein